MPFRLKYDSVENYLKSYGDYIVRQAKSILKSKRKVASGDLISSLKYRVVKNKEGVFDLEFLANKYADFLQKGVSGTNVSRSYIDASGKRVRSPYQFKKQPPSRVLDKWIIRRGIAPRDKGGKFTSRKGLSYVIARSIKRKGIRATSFYTQPLSYSFKKFKSDMLKNFKEDVLKGINVIAKKTI